MDRGLKKSKPPLINATAASQSLDILQINTFRDWTPPRHYNLVVAVSFGLLVPGRILSAAQYGGINVHPSLLPDLRGPAPITHSLLKQRQYTGVTLQTMHPTMFDHGAILAQSDKIPLHRGTAPSELLQILGSLGADLLYRGVDEGLFLQPQKDAENSSLNSGEHAFAPKVTPEDKHIDWTTWTAGQIQLRDRVLGDLWDTHTYSQCTNGSSSTHAVKRVTFHGPWELARADLRLGSRNSGEPEVVFSPFRKGLTIGIRTIDDKVLIPSTATVDGGPKGKGLQLLTAKLRENRRTAAFAGPSVTT